MHILVVEDDTAISRLVQDTFEHAGHRVTTTTHPHVAERLFIETAFDAAVLDVMLPAMDGRELCRRLKQMNDIPIISLTALGEWDDKKQGFTQGADDYMTKPFIPEELMFRLQTVAKRYQQSASTVIQLGQLTLDLSRYQLTIGEEAWHLPKKEFDLLYQLAAFPNRVFRREELIDRVWGMDFDGDERTLDVHVRRLRKRLTSADVQIRTIRGVGYTLEVSS